MTHIHVFLNALCLQGVHHITKIVDITKSSQRRCVRRRERVCVCVCVCVCVREKERERERVREREYEVGL